MSNVQRQSFVGFGVLLAMPVSSLLLLLFTLGVCLEQLSKIIFVFGLHAGSVLSSFDCALSLPYLILRDG